ncbi:MAG: aryl-sulfate sulfotransferase [Bacteroidota bacterium]
MISELYRRIPLSEASRQIPVVSLLLLLLIPITLHAETSAIEYVHPIPGARMVRSETNIIVVWADVDRIGGGDLEGMFEVTGSLSGRHGGAVSISDDERTVIFQPSRQFDAGEEVDVRLSGPEGRHFTLRFRVSAGTVRFPPPRGQSCCVTDIGIPPSDRSMEVRRPTQILPASEGTSPRAPSAAFAVSVPSDFPFVDIMVQDSPAEGKVFLNNWAGNPYLLILEDDGTPVYYKRMPAYARDFKVQPTGLLTYHVSGETNAFFAMDAGYTVVDSFRCGNGYVTDEHELLMLPNGHVLIIGKDYQTVDMSGIVPNGDPNALVVGNIVQELDTDHRVVFEWRSWDHFEITDCNHISLTAASIDYVHMNSIEVDTDGNLLFSSRHMSEVTKINRQAGNILWRLGGKKNQFTFIDDDLGISYQHDARSHGDGHYTIFDNGNYHSGVDIGGDDDRPVGIGSLPADQFSRAVEYVIDTLAMTATLVWEYRHDPILFSQWMGNAQRLPNGNTLICWADGSLPKITEVRPDGTTAYELDFVDYAHCYRAFRFPWSGKAAVPHLAVESRRDTVTLLMNTFGDSTVVRYRIYGGLSPNSSLLMDSAASSMHTLVGLQGGAFYYFRVTAVDGAGNQSGFSNEVSTQVRSIQPGENMLVNGDFSLGTQSWTLGQTEGAVATFYVTGQGECRLEISLGGPQTWSVQMSQGACVLERNREYVFEFDAYASRARTIETKVESVLEPRTNYSKTGTMFLNAYKEHFSYRFIMENPTDLDARVVFNCGKANFQVFIDNVSLREAVPDGVTGEGSDLPASYALHGAYPNPFNPSTKIRFSLPEQSDVGITLYDILGQAVRWVVDAPGKPGTHEVELDASGLASGVYICRMHAKPQNGRPDFSAALKLLLLK